MEIMTPIMKTFMKLCQSSFLGALVGFGTVSFLELCQFFGTKILNHNLLFALAIVWATFKRGYLAGLYAVAIAIVYTVIRWSAAGNLFSYSSNNLGRLVIVCLCMPLIVLLVGRLKSQTDSQKKELAYYVSQLEVLAGNDGLTELANRRSFNQHLKWSVQNIKRSIQPFSLAIIDLDHFKQINDTHGHQVGDCVLSSVATVLKRACRENDFSARIGGEEFAIIFHGTNVKDSIVISERIRSQIADLDIGGIKVSASIGLVSLPPGSVVVEPDVLRNADEALYAAKDAGRNRVIHFSELSCNWKQV